MLQSQNLPQVMVCNASWTGAPCHHHVLPPQNNHYVGSGRIEKVGLCFILKALCHFGWKKAKTAIKQCIAMSLESLVTDTKSGWTYENS